MQECGIVNVKGKATMTTKVDNDEGVLRMKSEEANTIRVWQYN